MSEPDEGVPQLIEHQRFGRSWTRNTKAPLKLTDKIKIGDDDHATHTTSGRPPKAGSSLHIKGGPPISMMRQWRRSNGLMISASVCDSRAEREPEIRTLFNQLTDDFIAELMVLLTKLDIEATKANADLVHALFVGCRSSSWPPDERGQELP